MSTKSLIVVGNGFIGKFIAWRSQTLSAFTLTRDYLAELKTLPTSDEYIVIWAHGESRGADMRASQIDTLRSCSDAMRDLGLDTRMHIYVSSTKVHEDPMSDFASVKAECEGLIQALSPSPYILRVPNVYSVFSRPRANSVLSRWLLESSEIHANSDTREYISLDALSRFIDDCVHGGRSPGTYNLRGEPLTMSEIGYRISKLRNLPFQSVGGAMPIRGQRLPEPADAIEVPAPDDLGLVESLESLRRASSYARDLQSRVQTSSRFHSRSDTQHYLQDLDTEVLENLRRVYAFNVLVGHRRGGHYHMDQTETFYVAQGVCEVLLESGEGSGIVTLMQGQYIQVNPMEQHTFRPISADVTVIAVSDLAYIPNSVPDTYIYSKGELVHAP